MIPAGTYLHGATVRRTDSGKDYLVEMTGGFPYMTPLEGNRVGAPVSNRFLFDNFDLVKASSYEPPQ